jgi:hypothetical protein
MRFRIAIVATVVAAPIFVVAPPAAEAHNCVEREPYCVDVRSLVQRPGRQEIVTRQLGHHCANEGEENAPGADKRVLYSRIGVVFSDVARRSGFFERVTIYFDGRERQIMGAVDAWGKRNDFSEYNGQPYDPGFSISYDVKKRVEFGDDSRSKNFGQYVIQHQSAASGPVGVDGPSRRPPPGLRPDCAAAHHLVLIVVPPRTPPCNTPPPQPCAS